MAEFQASSSAAKLDRELHQNKRAEDPDRPENIRFGWSSDVSAAFPLPYIVINSSTWTKALLLHNKVRRRHPAGVTGRITIQAADNLLRAVEFAETLDRPLRHHLTIRWPCNDWCLHQPMQQLVAKWLGRNVGGAFYVWAKEGQGGAHSHFLVHLGSFRGGVLRREVIRGLTRLADLPGIEKGAVQCRGVHSFGEASAHTARRAAYLCKGSDPLVRALLGLRKPELERIDSGKRSGVSQSLGVAARRNCSGAL